MTTLSSKKSINRSPLRFGFILIPLALAWFALSPTSLAQLPSPAPDGGYPGNNTAEGTNALFSLTTGAVNTAIGFQALLANTTDGEVAVGYQALRSNTTSGGLTAVGYQALYSNTTGGGNTAMGNQALYSNTTGNQNVGYGNLTLLSNTTGNRNTAVGNQALENNTTGNNNTATGQLALFSKHDWQQQHVRR